jgi:selenocysteine lyase/cysteine desulfurase
MRENLRVILEVGSREIEARVVFLARSLARGLLDQGCEVITPIDSLDSGILCFRSPHVPVRELWDCLKRSDIVCSLRQGWVRVSPHFYNTEDEIRVLLDIVQEQSKK